ncbi:RICIN domain-containing protein [Beggiatoa leptomitoformis]|uniref:RICIN domain-containing protein n=1 Tax=Beggiatoa leptomitoformis TaxID=288004 RepID=UPI000783986E|nr:RICIN domain-containing protein [Beggiatoa leptomitoformis]
MFKRVLGLLPFILFSLPSYADNLDKVQQALEKKLQAAREATSNKRFYNEGGKCLDIGGNPNEAGTNVQIWDCNDAPNQKWRLEGGKLINEAGKCLDAGGDVKKAGTNAQIWGCNDAPNQQWRLEGGRLVNAGGKCLDVGGDINKVGTNVQIWDCNDAPNQKWHW